MNAKLKKLDLIITYVNENPFRPCLNAVGLDVRMFSDY